MKLPQLTLRDLFWLVLVCALGCAWWVEHRRLQAAWMRADTELLKIEYSRQGRLIPSIPSLSSP